MAEKNPELVKENPDLKKPVEKGVKEDAEKVLVLVEENPDLKGVDEEGVERIERVDLECNQDQIQHINNGVVLNT